MPETLLPGRFVITGLAVTILLLMRTDECWQLGCRLEDLRGVDLGKAL